MKYTYAATIAPVSSIASTAARRVAEAKIESGSIGEVTIRSVITNPIASMTEVASAINVAVLVKPSCWPWLTPKIKVASELVASAAPRTSSRCPPAAAPAGTTRWIATSISAISGGLTRKIAR